MLKLSPIDNGVVSQVHRARGVAASVEEGAAAQRSTVVFRHSTSQPLSSASGEDMEDAPLGGTPTGDYRDTRSQAASTQMTEGHVKVVGTLV